MPSIWQLDLRLRADNRVYVGGMGLESEWSADLRVEGTRVVLTCGPARFTLPTLPVEDYPALPAMPRPRPDGPGLPRR